MQIMPSDERLAYLAARAAHESKLFSKEDYEDAAALLRELIERRGAPLQC